MSLLDFSKNREVEYSFIDKNGEKHTFSKVLTAQDIDKFKEVQEKNTDKIIKSAKIMNAGIKNIENAELDLNGVMKVLNGDHTVRDELIKIFLDDNFDKFKEITKGYYNIVADDLNKVLLTSIDELSNSIFNKEEEDKPGN